MIKEHEVTGVGFLRDNKHKVTTRSRKDDDTNSTATVTTTAVTSVCESEWNNYITEGLAETTTLNDQIYVFGKRGERLYPKSTREDNNPSLTQQTMYKQE